MNKNCHEYNMIWKLSESDTMSLWTYMYSLAIACLLILFWRYCAIDKVGLLNSDMLKQHCQGNEICVTQNAKLKGFKIQNLAKIMEFNCGEICAPKIKASQKFYVMRYFLY